MPSRIEGKWAVITGASAGIGAATALELAEEGCRLVLGARRMDRLAELKSKLEARFPGRDVRAVALDVADPASCAAFIEVARAAGPIEILVNNAGLARGADKLVQASDAAWTEMIDTNVLGLLRLTRGLLPDMIARKSGTIVNVGSVAALEPYGGGTVYCATKAAVRAVSKALRHELLGSNVRVTTVEPGAVETEFSVVRFGGDRDRAKHVYRGFTPLVAQDVAEVIRFVCSRPQHVVLEEVTMYPVAQASTTAYHREP
ncbi:MAG: SDR family NAD(P)-dependent oxidoreductase [Myxococcales bacterium]